jgi:hypothetical protein
MKRILVLMMMLLVSVVVYAKVKDSDKLVGVWQKNSKHLYRNYVFTKESMTERVVQKDTLEQISETEYMFETAVIDNTKYLVFNNYDGLYKIYTYVMTNDTLVLNSFLILNNHYGTQLIVTEKSKQMILKRKKQ